MTTQKWYNSSAILIRRFGVTSKRTDDYAVLEEEVTSDIAVIGAGFCGLSTALHLSERGKKVTIIDAHEPVSASGRKRTSYRALKSCLMKYLRGLGLKGASRL